MMRTLLISCSVTLMSYSVQQWFSVYLAKPGHDGIFFRTRSAYKNFTDWSPPYIYSELAQLTDCEHEMCPPMDCRTREARYPVMAAGVADYFRGAGTVVAEGLGISDLNALNYRKKSEAQAPSSVPISKAAAHPTNEYGHIINEYGQRTERDARGVKLSSMDCLVCSCPPEDSCNPFALPLSDRIDKKG